MVLAHQYLGQLSSGLEGAFDANTAIKLAGGVSARDAGRSPDKWVPMPT